MGTLRAHRGHNPLTGVCFGPCLPGVRDTTFGPPGQLFAVPARKPHPRSSEPAPALPLWPLLELSPPRVPRVANTRQGDGMGQDLSQGFPGSFGLPPAVKPQLGKGSLSWAGNPLLPPQPSLEGEGRGIFSAHPPLVPRIELKRGIDVQRRAGFALKGRVCVFPTTPSLQNFPVKRGW